MPLVSVIIPVYNVELYLRRCLDSLLAQTLQDIEIICVDDGSSDGSPQILDEYANRDSRVRVIHQENAGVSAARNVGLSLVRSPYVGFVDSDDWVEPETYQAAVRHMQDDGVDLVCWGNCTWIEQENSWVMSHKEKPFNHKSFFHLNGKLVLKDEIKCALLGPIWDKLFRMKEIREYDISFPEGIGIHEDTVFASAYLAWAKSIFVMDSYPYCHRAAPDSILDKASNNKKQVCDVFPSVFAEIYKYYKKYAIEEKERLLLAQILVIVLRHGWRFSLDYGAFIEAARKLVMKYRPLYEVNSDLYGLVRGKPFIRLYPLSFMEKMVSVANVGSKKVFRLFGLEFSCDRKQKNRIAG